MLSTFSWGCAHEATPHYPAVELRMFFFRTYFSLVLPPGRTGIRARLDLNVWVFRISA